MSLILRAMQIEDINTVLAIEKAAHRAPWTHEILKECVVVGYDCRILELEDGEKNKIIGYIIARYNSDNCHILNLCIANEHQQQGYGKYLLNSFLNSLEKPGVTSIYLEVRPSNLDAIYLYNRFGFIEIDIKKDYYSNHKEKEDAIVLVKTIVNSL